MERIWSIDIDGHIGEDVVLAGWIHRFRQLSGVSFLILRDAKGLAQIVIEDPGLVSEIARLPLESVVSVTGRVVAVEQAPNGVEIHDPRITIISEAVEPPPFDLFRPKIQALLPTQLDHAPLSLRHLRARALTRLSAALVSGFRATLTGLDFTEIHTPKIVAAATESGANVFAIDYFGRPAFLAQSPQLYKQIMVGVFERVFEVGPVFRAEPHDTPRHLNEYVSLDAEMGFIVDHTTIMELLTTVIRGMLAQAGDSLGATLEQFKIALPELSASIPAVHFADAQRMISAATGENLEGEFDLAPSHERWLGEWARTEYDSDFLFVTGYPRVKRPFYTHPDPSRPDFTNGFDLLFRGLELVTGGQRLHRYADYLDALTERGFDPEPLGWYLEAFKHGMPPHGGFAIGLERFVSRIAGIENVREVTLFPRDLNRLVP